MQLLESVEPLNPLVVDDLVANRRLRALGTEDEPTEYAPLDLTFVALLRVRVYRPVVYAVELVFRDE